MWKIKRRINICHIANSVCSGKKGRRGDGVIKETTLDQRLPPRGACSRRAPSSITLVWAVSAVAQPGATWCYRVPFWETAVSFLQYTGQEWSFSVTSHLSFSLTIFYYIKNAQSMESLIKFGLNIINKALALVLRYRLILTGVGLDPCHVLVA